MKEERKEIFTPVQTKRASEVLYEELRGRIRSGYYRPGDKLPSERVMMEEFSRSHPTVREALRLLEGAGYVDVVHGAGIIVREINERIVTGPWEDLIHFRRVTIRDMEEFFSETAPVFAKHAAAHHVEDDEAELKRCFDRLRKAQAAPVKFFRYLMDFHVALIRTFRNPLATIIWKGTADMVELLPSFNRYGELSTIVKEHRRLLDSYIEQDGKKAMERMRTCWRTMKILSPEIQIVRTPGVQAAKSVKASDLIYEQIRSRILQGKLVPGDKLPPERKLMEYFGKSRPVVREALKMLETKNYVTTSRGSGTVVNSITTEDIEKALIYMVDGETISLRDIHELRCVSEPFMAKLAADRRTEENLLAMEKILEEADAGRDNRETVIEMGNRFNLEIADASKNKLIQILCTLTSTFLHDQYVEEPSSFQVEDYNIAASQHYAILEAIRSKDSEAAEKQTQIHLQELISRNLFAWEKSTVIY